MNRICFTAALTLFALSTAAQESTPRAKRSLVVYNLTDWEKYSFSEGTGDSIFLRTGESSLRIFHPTIAYRWEEHKGRYHEVELINFHLSTKEHSVQPVVPTTGAAESAVEGEQITRLAFSARYEYQTSIRYNEDRPWGFSIGMGINPYYFLHTVRPLVTTNFPERVHVFGTRLYAVPRFTWHISERIFLDVNLPFCVGEFRLRYHYDENPVLAINERGRRTAEFSTLPALFSGRIGLGFKLF